MKCKEQNAYRGDDIRGEKEYKASVANEEEQLGTQRPHTQTVLKLSFSEDQSFSKAPFGEDQNMSELPTGDEQSLLDSTHAEESNMKETVEVSIVAEQDKFEVFSFEEIDGSTFSEEGIEPSTDEESRSWRYPQDKVCKEENVSVKEEERELESSRVEKENRVSVSDHSELSDILDGDCELGDVSAEIAGSSEMQEDKKPRPDEDESESCLDNSVKPQSNLNRDQGNIKSCEGFSAMKLNQKDTRECTHRKDMRQQSKEIQKVNTKNMDLKSDRRGPSTRVKQTEASPLANVALALKETQMGYTEFERNIKDLAKPEVEAESSDIDGQSLTEVRVSDHLFEREEMEQDAVDDRQAVVDGLTGETRKAEGGASSKKVTFILEPELINDSTLSEASTSMESRAETSMSGEISKKV